MKAVLILILTFSLAAIADEAIPEPPESMIYVLAPELQSKFLPSPLAVSHIEWDKNTGGMISFDKQGGHVLFVSGKLKDARLFLNDHKLPLDRSRFQFSLPLLKDPGSFLFTVEDSGGTRSAFRLHYYWLKYPSEESKVLIKDEEQVIEKSVERKGDFSSREWLVFSWKKEELPQEAEPLWKRVARNVQWLSLRVGGIADLQSGGGKLFSGVVAYSPFWRREAYRVRGEFGVSPLKNKSSDIFFALNYEIFFGYQIKNWATVEAGGGLETFTGASGGTALVAGVQGDIPVEWLPYQDKFFVGYSQRFIDPAIHQFRIGLGFSF